VGVTKPASKRGLDDFRKAYDKSLIVPSKIKAGLADLGNAWESEAEFIRRCGVSQSEFGRYREPFLADHAVEVRGRGSRDVRVWAGTKAFATKLRASVVQ
jgi:hypothetical protein